MLSLKKVTPRQASQVLVRSLHRTAPSFTRVQLTDQGLHVQLTPERAPDIFPYVWLRDSDPQLVHPSTRQKLHASMDVPSDAPVEARLVNDEGVLQVTWPADAGKTKWPSQSRFPLDFLLRHVDATKAAKFHRDASPVAWTWDQLQKSDHLALPYTDLPDASKRSHALEQLVRYGILFVTGVPHEELSKEDGEIPKLAAHFGEIHETFYGRMWDVQTHGEESRNIAYTHLDLGLHMDLEYFEHPPRYQVLQMIRNRGITGGASIFSDGLHAALSLREESPEQFHVLTTSPVGFQYINDGHHQYGEHPTIELGPKGDVAYINYSPPFQSPLPLSTARDPRFVPALGRFRSLLESSERLYERRLEEGDAVIFDNRRVLHGRRRIEQTAGASSSLRLLRGCYIQADSILDRLRGSLADRV